MQFCNLYLEDHRYIVKYIHYAPYSVSNQFNVSHSSISGLYHKLLFNRIDSLFGN